MKKNGEHWAPPPIGTDYERNLDDNDTWCYRFLIPALIRFDHFEQNLKGVSVGELVEERDGALMDLFLYWLGLPPEKQRACARRWAEGLREQQDRWARVRELAEREYLRRTANG